MAEPLLSFTASLSQGRRSLTFSNEGDCTVSFDVSAQDAPKLAHAHALLVDQAFRVAIVEVLPQ